MDVMCLQLQNILHMIYEQEMPDLNTGNHAEKTTCGENPEQESETSYKKDIHTEVLGLKYFTAQSVPN